MIFARAYAGGQLSCAIGPRVRIPVAAMRVARVPVSLLRLMVIVAAGGLLFVDQVPPRSLTDANMHVMKRRILRFASAHNALPTSFDQLPHIEGFSNEVTDGWGRPIMWRVEGDVVSLVSYGRDGAPGGVAEDEDLVATFNTKTFDGRWADEICNWLVNPMAPTALGL